MYQVLYDVALRLGLGIILGFLLLVFITIVETAFYNHSKQIHLGVIITLLALIIYALGDIALDVLHI
ncbi:Uncharacterised protein [uncultured archaeon]|nr:Uncharacterised protein [uncultured archaeon]